MISLREAVARVIVTERESETVGFVASDEASELSTAFCPLRIRPG